MNEFNYDDILKEEFEAIKADVISLYNASNKRTSGEFENGLEIKFDPNKAMLSGYVYLSGRAAGKQPPIQAIEKWLIQKGIQPIEQNMKISSLAFLIARKIAKEGTRKANHLKIYEQVITPQRIDKILERINKVNVTAFADEIITMILQIENK